VYLTPRAKSWLLTAAVLIAVTVAIFWAAAHPATAPAVAPTHHSLPAVKKAPKPWMVYHSGTKAAKKRAKHKYSVAEVKAVIRRVAPKKEWADLMVLARRESDFDNRCVTGRYRGVFQVEGHHGWIFDPFWNTGLARREMIRTYSSVHGARLHSNRTGWW
jgi:hypothetical protein